MSSPDRTSLRRTESHYRKLGYNVRYVEYNTLTSNPKSDIYREMRNAGSGEVIVIGHSLGGFWVNQVASENPNSRASFYTVNSPFARSHDNVQDLKHTSDWSNVLQFFWDSSAFGESKWSSGAHSVTKEQVVR